MRSWLSFLTALSMVLTSVAFAMPGESLEFQLAERTAKARGFKTFKQAIATQFKNDKKTAGEYLALLKKNHIKPATRFPQMEMIGREIYFGGYPRPIEVIALAPVGIKIAQSKWSFNSSQSLEQNFTSLRDFLNKSLTEKSAGRISFFLPEANAEDLGYGVYNIGVGLITGVMIALGLSDKPDPEGLAKKPDDPDRLDAAELARASAVKVLPSLTGTFCLAETDSSLNAEKVTQFREGKVPRLVHMTPLLYERPQKLEVVWGYADPKSGKELVETVEYSLMVNAEHELAVTARARKGQRIVIHEPQPGIFSGGYNLRSVADRFEDGRPVADSLAKLGAAYTATSAEVAKLPKWSVDDTNAKPVHLEKNKLSMEQGQALRSLTHEHFRSMCNAELMKEKMKALAAKIDSGSTKPSEAVQ